jgi:hypothetical protein
MKQFLILAVVLMSFLSAQVSFAAVDVAGAQTFDTLKNAFEFAKQNSSTIDTALSVASTATDVAGKTESWFDDHGIDIKAILKAIGTAFLWVAKLVIRVVEYLVSKL